MVPPVPRRRSVAVFGPLEPGSKRTATAQAAPGASTVSEHSSERSWKSPRSAPARVAESIVCAPIDSFRSWKVWVGPALPTATLPKSRAVGERLSRGATPVPSTGTCRAPSPAPKKLKVAAVAPTPVGSNSTFATHDAPGSTIRGLPAKRFEVQVSSSMWKLDWSPPETIAMKKPTGRWPTLVRVTSRVCEEPTEVGRRRAGWGRLRPSAARRGRPAAR